jgi:spermidine/putrescine-binding protein
MHHLRHSTLFLRAVALLLTASLLLAACGGAAPAPDASSPVSASPAASSAAELEGNLVALEWAGYELPQFYEPFFAQNPKATVDYSFFSEDAEAFAKLLSGFSVDVVHPAIPGGAFMSSKGWCSPSTPPS